MRPIGMLVALDGGMGASAIAALPTGPRRDLEIAIWRDRILAGPRALVFAAPLTDAELDAAIDLDAALAAECGRRS